MPWPHTVCMIVPANLLDVANRVAKALDPDMGGDGTFTVPLPDAASPTHYGASSAAAVGFVQTINAVLSGQADLSLLVAAEYAARWPELQVPTERECVDFLAAATIIVDRPFWQIAEDMGLVLTSGEL